MEEGFSKGKLITMLNITKEYLKYLYITQKKSAKETAAFLKISESTLFKYLNNWEIHKLEKYRFNRNVFDVFSAESCYWAGFIAADGNISTGRLTIVLNQIDTNHINKFCDFINFENRNIEKIISGVSNTNCCKIRINSVYLTKSLFNNFNIISNKSLVLAPPINIPEFLIRHYIRGFFDGDGCISWCKSNHSPEFTITTGSFNILKWIRDNLKKNVSIGNPSILKKKNSNCFSLKFGGVQVYKIMDWLYDNISNEIYLDRKFIKYNNLKGNIS